MNTYETRDQVRNCIEREVQTGYPVIEGQQQIETYPDLEQEGRVISNLLDTDNSNSEDSEYWKNKYLNLLEKYNLLLESKLN